MTVTPIDPAAAILPTALALALAVSDYDEPAVTTLLANLDREQMRALAIVLAAHVDLDQPMTPRAPEPEDDWREEAVHRAIALAAVMFNLDPRTILSRDQHRPVADARAVAMAALRLTGLTCTYIGEAFGRDHTTVVHAAGRVGEDSRLRRLSVRVAEQLGWDRNREDVAS